jgi:endonuclease/exonuclease/phosphatase family metal-dependent hydrolase
MRRILSAILLGSLALILIACGIHVAHSGDAPAPARQPGTLRIASHNVHYIMLEDIEGPWSVPGWEARKSALDAVFKALDADIVAFQEMESFRHGDDGSVNLARDYMLAENPGYGVAASGDWRVFPSTQPILYRKDRMQVLDQGWFFFSETPDVIYSRTFDGSYPAFASWARFRDRAAGRDFTVMNLHTDYKSRHNRSRTFALVAERVRPMIAADDPVFLVGDFNERNGSGRMAGLKEEGMTFPQVPGATYHFNRGINLFPAIDHIGMAGRVALQQGPFVLRHRPGGVWPSDHYPLAADFRFLP